MKLNKTLIGILAILLILSGCKKDDDSGIEEILEMEEGINNAPSAVTPSLPENSASLVVLAPKLEWEAASDPEGKEIVYDIFFGMDAGNLPLLTNNISATEHQLDMELQKGTSYFWKVIAKDPENESSESGIFTFKTQYVTETQLTGNAPFSKRSFSTTTVFNDKIWVIGGQDEDRNVLADVWSSADGSNWNLETDAAAFGPRKSHAVVVFENKMWVYSGSDGSYLNNEIWSSTDGMNWVQEENDSPFNKLPFYGQTANTMFVFDDKIWRLAAYDGSIGDLTSERYIWNSADGKNWNLVSENHGLDKKYGMAVVEFQGKLMALEGSIDEGNKFNKVWESTDGINWDLRNENIPFEFGSYTGAVVHQDKLFVTTGSGYQELWFTEDGSNWTKAVESREYPTRHVNSSIAFNNKIFIVGGGTHITAYNDVWVIE
ncbi:MAG: hypothetical protein KJP26_05500 [Maribacter sp.]|nr:hypothetical protein [Maribacter sp.]